MIGFRESKVKCFFLFFCVVFCRYGASIRQFPPSRKRTFGRRNTACSCMGVTLRLGDAYLSHARTRPSCAQVVRRGWVGAALSGCSGSGGETAACGGGFSRRAIVPG